MSMSPTSVNKPVSNWSPDMPSSRPNNSPWICHICDRTGQGESIACSQCFKVACSQHIRHLTHYDRDSGLYQLLPVCFDCALKESLK